MQFKQWSFIGIFFFISSSVWAQGFNFGVKAGVDMVSNHIHFKKNESFTPISVKPIIGFNVNAILNYRLSEEIGITLEPGYIQKGWTAKHRNIEKIIFNYWQLPILVDYHLSEKWALSIGPEVAFYKKKYQHDPREALELGGVLGVNYRISEHFATGLRAGSAILPSLSLNLTDINGNDIGKYKEYNQYLQLSLEYWL